jgi:hypothetical protein
LATASCESQPPIIATLLAVPTEIYFAGSDTSVRVDDGPDQVLDAFTAAGGLPFRLTAYGGFEDIYVNPATVSYWRAWAPPTR